MTTLLGLLVFIVFLIATVYIGLPFLWAMWHVAKKGPVGFLASIFIIATAWAFFAYLGTQTLKLVR